MKKNISINLFGTLYAIDEDAYTLLERYLNSMKSYFARQEGGEEIADDIEHRVAELLWQQKQRGMEAVNIDTVKSIIAKIGNPAEIDSPLSDDGESGSTQAEAGRQPTAEPAGDARPGADAAERGSESNGFQYSDPDTSAAGSSARSGVSSFFDGLRQRIKTRRLYRDPNDKMLGGVLSGLNHYFDTPDPLWWRLGFVVLLVFQLMFDMWVALLPLLYLALWILVPEALTPEDQLRMKGRPINPENLNEQLLHETPTSAAASATGRNSTGHAALKILLGICLLVLVGPLFFIFLFVIFAILITLGAAGGFLGVLLPVEIMGGGFQHLPDFITENSNIIWLCIFSWLLTIGLPVFALVRHLLISSKPLSRGTRLTLLAVWVVALMLSILTLINGGTRFASFIDQADTTTYDYPDDDYAADSVEEDTVVLTDTTYSVPAAPQTLPADSLAASADSLAPKA